VRRDSDRGYDLPEARPGRLTWELAFLLFDREAGLVRRHSRGIVAFVIVAGGGLLVEQALVGIVLPRIVLELRP
jgi:hypothetical protein